MRRVVLFLSLFSLLSINVLALSSKEDIKANAMLYEKAIEKKVSGELQWYPFPEGELEAEYGVDYQLGISDNPSSYTYFYDESKGYLIQYFDLSKDGIIIWKGEVPIAYEEFN